jgi:hypothetical protein
MNAPENRRLNEIRAAQHAYRRALAKQRLGRVLKAARRLYRAHGEPFGKPGLAIWLEYETGTTRN